MYLFDSASRLSDAGSPHVASLIDDLAKYIAGRRSSDVEARINEERTKLNRTLVIIAENHSATTRSADLARRLLENEVYRYIASEAFLNAGPLRIEVRQFLKGARTSLSSVLCPYTKLLQSLQRTPRFILFAGTRADDNRDPRLARHFLDEVVDRKLARTTPGILICGINHGSRAALGGRGKTMRRRLEDAGFKVLGVRLATDDVDRAECRLNNRLWRTDSVWPLGETPTESNAIHLVDHATTGGEYTVLPTKGSPFERLTDDSAGGSSSVSMADRYELVVLAKKMPEPCRSNPCAEVKT